MDLHDSALLSSSFVSTETKNLKPRSHAARHVAASMLSLSELCQDAASASRRTRDTAVPGIQRADRDRNALRMRLGSGMPA